MGLRGLLFGGKSDAMSCVLNSSAKTSVIGGGKSSIIGVNSFFRINGISKPYPQKTVTYNQLSVVKK